MERRSTFVSLGNAVSRHDVSPYMIYRAKLGKEYAEIDYYIYIHTHTHTSLEQRSIPSLLENAKNQGDGGVVGRRAMQKFR